MEHFMALAGAQQMGTVRIVPVDGGCLMPDVTSAWLLFLLVFFTMQCHSMAPCFVYHHQPLSPIP